MFSSENEDINSKGSWSLKYYRIRFKFVKKAQGKKTTTVSANSKQVIKIKNLNHIFIAILIRWLILIWLLKKEELDLDPLAYNCFEIFV